MPARAQLHPWNTAWAEHREGKVGLGAGAEQRLGSDRKGRKGTVPDPAAVHLGP